MPTSEPDRTAIVRAPRDDLPPVGTHGRVVGGRGTVEDKEFCLRFPDLSEVWLRLPAEAIELPAGEAALAPPAHRYAMTRDPRWWVMLLARLRLHRFLPQPDERLLGRTVTVTSPRFGVPVGRRGTIGGYEGGLYVIGFEQYFDRIVTPLPAAGLAVAEEAE